MHVELKSLQTIYANCAECGRVYRQVNKAGIVRPEMKYCGARCRQVANARVQRERRAEKLSSRDCLECGRTFTPQHKSHQEYCSKKCRQRAHYRRSRA